MDEADLFTSDRIALAEGLQREQWRALSCAAGPEVVRAMGVRVADAGPVLYQGALGAPGAQFNKVFSFGLDGDRSPEAVGRAAGWLRENCPPGSLLMAPPADDLDGLDARLRQGGLRRHPMDIAIFHMDAADAPERPPSSDVEVRAVSREDAPVFGRVLAEGLGVPAADAWLAAFAADAPHMTGYVAWLNGTAIGAAGLYAQGGWGWLCVAAVPPAFRRRGAQTALLSHRISEAVAAGLETLIIGAMRPTPEFGDEAFASYRNIERAGFRPAYFRRNYVLAE